MEPLMKARIADALSVTGESLKCTGVSGGSINETYRITTNEGSWFCKINSAGHFPAMFEKEAFGLAQLRATGSIRVPGVLVVLYAGREQCLLMEWIRPGKPSGTFWKRFGEQLALLHSNQAEMAGFSEDNYMGSLVQSNGFDQPFSAFFRERRLKVQVARSVQNGLLEKQDIAAFERLYDQLPSIFPPERNVLLHGDLWSGNFLCDAGEHPVLIDPAVYFGSRHVDLAMTTLFGGFEKAFYEAYSYHYSLKGDHTRLWEVCNLYPLLVHLNLFGTAYLSAIRLVLKHF